MTIIAIDDTDSRTEGMCTTYVGHLIAKSLESNYNESVRRVQLVRLNPAAKHKTRGNAAVAIHTTADPQTGLNVASEFVSELSATADDMTNPAVVVAPNNNVPNEISQFTTKTLTSLREISEAENLIDKHNYLSYYLGNGRGRIGCLAAIGSWDCLNDWTYECISYRESDNRGTERQIDYDSVFEESNKAYPKAWDTVDRRIGSAVCVPNTPGPILYGIRGDCSETVEEVAKSINSREPIESYQLFVTNQGTDAHIVEVDNINQMSPNTAYKVSGVVSEEPKTREGGHVQFKIEDESGSTDVIAFEPTKHFRDKVRDLRNGDEIIIMGEYSKRSLKLEKFAVCELNKTKKENPTCPDCKNSMSSAGKNQGYRCKKCKNSKENKNIVEIERKLDIGWYEVPPCARRHISKPLIRGGFDCETHPFK